MSTACHAVRLVGEAGEAVVHHADVIVVALLVLVEAQGELLPVDTVGRTCLANEVVVGLTPLHTVGQVFPVTAGDALIPEDEIAALGVALIAAVHKPPFTWACELTDGFVGVLVQFVEGPPHTLTGVNVMVVNEQQLHGLLH